MCRLCWVGFVCLAESAYGAWCSAPLQPCSHVMQVAKKTETPVGCLSLPAMYLSNWWICAELHLGRLHAGCLEGQGSGSSYLSHRLLCNALHGIFPYRIHLASILGSLWPSRQPYSSLLQDPYQGYDISTKFYHIWGRLYKGWEQ